MNRRSNVVSGWVNFPVNDPAWRSTKEGGMVVKLVVVDNQEFNNQFAVCSGAFVYDIISESFAGDDKRPRPNQLQSYDSAEDVIAEQEAFRLWESYHYPRVTDVTAEGIEPFISRAYLACLVMGTTGWSGWSDSEERLWQCTFDDLTDEGKALYRQLEALYSGCDLHLLTFLDT